jgi:hypothetical protein
MATVPKRKRLPWLIRAGTVMAMMVVLSVGLRFWQEATAESRLMHLADD